MSIFTSNAVHMPVLHLTFVPCSSDVQQFSTCTSGIAKLLDTPMRSTKGWTKLVGGLNSLNEQHDLVCRHPALPSSSATTVLYLGKCKLFRKP